MSTGLYISVPFCRTKCSYCNFASGVFSRQKYAAYVDHVRADMARAAQIAAEQGGSFDPRIDSIYLGGGTPTVLELDELKRLFFGARQSFDVSDTSEVTVECAPGTLTAPMIEALPACGVNRVSLGVQSFVDEEAAAVGRLHTRTVVLDDIARLRAAGIANINVDLIAGLPHQTAESWERSLADVIATDVPHISVYMLEVDEDSRLGRELIAGGTRYHAHFVPDSDLTADLYVTACERLETASVRQYEISNFARDGAESKHNLKYWTRQPYLGFGVDAHSMIQPRAELRTADVDAVRYAWPDSLEAFLNENEHRPAREAVSVQGALEETFFVGLRLNRGVDLEDVARQYGKSALDRFSDTISDLRDLGVLEQDGNRLRLTARGRLLSNEVFERFVTGVTEEPTRATSEDEPDAPLVQIRAGSH